MTEIYKDGDDVVVTTELENEYRAPAVIVTAGGNPRKLEVPGEPELAGRGVSYCAICDGAFFKGKPVAVVGGGDSAVEEGTFLTRYASKVHLIHRRADFRAQAIAVQRAKADPKVESVLDTVVRSHPGQGQRREHQPQERQDRRNQQPRGFSHLPARGLPAQQHHLPGPREPRRAGLPDHGQQHGHQRPRHLRRG